MPEKTYIAGSPARPFISAFDLMNAMRALAAFAVLFSHERNILFLDATTGLSNLWRCFYFVTGFGHEAVMIFFVLSGYWITKTVVRRSFSRHFDWLEYGIDRLSRLWIVLIPALVIGGAFDIIGRYAIIAPIYLGTQGTNTLTWDVGVRLSLSNIAGNAVFLQTLFVDPLGSNGPLWSLTNEFWYYLWFPSIYQIIIKRRASVYLFLAVVVTMIAFRSLLPGFACWLFGSMLFYATRNPTCPNINKVIVALESVTATVIFVATLFLARLNTLIDGRVIDVAVSGSFALFLFAMIRRGNSYPGWLAPLCRYGSRSSYSLYVVHFPFIVFLAALYFAPEHRFPPSAAIFFVFAVMGFVAILFGFIVSAVTEGNTSKARRWLKVKLLRVPDGPD